MSAFYYPFELNKNEIINISGDEFKHIKVQRKLSNTLNLTNGLGQSAIAEVIELQKSQITLKITEVFELKNENIKDITLFFGLIDDKNRIEILIEKATELGVKEIYPVFCKNSQFKKFDIKRAERKAIAAIKQSERSVLPKISEIIDFKVLLDKLKNFDISILADIGGDDNIKLNYKNISICVGPEGGFSEVELNQLSSITTKLKVGNSVLRTETAAIAILSKIL